MPKSQQDRTAGTGHALACGIEAPGVAAVAESLAAGGMRVTASADRPASGFRVHDRVRLRIDQGAPAWRPLTRLLVHGVGVEITHPLRLGALRRGVPQQTPSDWLSEGLEGHVGIVFAGGLDASVAAAMTAEILTHAGWEPSVLLETPSVGLGGRAQVGAGATFVAQWPAHSSSLQAPFPGMAVVLGGDQGIQCNGEEWAKFVAKVAATAVDGQSILAYGHPSYEKDEGSPTRVEWVSLRRGSDWWATDLREESGRFRFRIFHRGRYVIEVKLSQPGLRHVPNALVATAACHTLGVSDPAIREGLEDFAGLARVFETRGSYRGVTLVDDHAPDPGAVFDALTLARQVWGRRRLWAVLDGSAWVEECRHRPILGAMALADRVLVTGGESYDVLAVEAERIGLKLELADCCEGAVAALDRLLEPGDVLLTLGPGDVGTIADAFIRRLQRDRPGQ